MHHKPPSQTPPSRLKMSLINSENFYFRKLTLIARRRCPKVNLPPRAQHCAVAVIYTFLQRFVFLSTFLFSFLSPPLHR